MRVCLLLCEARLGDDLFVGTVLYLSLFVMVDEMRGVQGRLFVSLLGAHFSLALIGDLYEYPKVLL